MTIAFDTLAFAHRLEEAGLDRKISEAVASAIQDVAMSQVATKGDVREAVREAVHTMTVRTGAMIGAAVAILGVLVSLH